MTVVSASGVYRGTGLDEAIASYSVAFGVSRLLNFSRAVLLAWFMSPQEFGLLSLMLLATGILTPLGTLGLNQAVGRYAPQHEVRGTLAPFLARSLAVVTGVVAASVFLMVLFAPTLGDILYGQLGGAPRDTYPGRGDVSRIALLSALVFALLSGYFYLVETFAGLRMFAALSRLEIAHTSLFLLLGAAALLAGSGDALALTVAYALSVGIPGVWFGWGLRRALGARQESRRPGLTAPATTRLLRYGAFTMLASLSWPLLLNYQVWFLNKTHGHEAVAVFTAVRQIGLLIPFVGIAMGSVIGSMITRAWEQQGRETAERQWSLAFRATAIGLFLGCTVVALGKDVAIGIVGPAYAQGAAVLPIQLLFFLIAANLTLLSLPFRLLEKSGHLVWPWATGILVNALVAFWVMGGGGTGDLARALGPLAVIGGATGTGDPHGLHAASWCGVIAITGALGVCLALLAGEGRTLGRGGWIALLAGVLLVARPAILTTGAAVILVLTLRTGAVFTAAERAALAAHAVGALRSLLALRGPQNRHPA